MSDGAMCEKREPHYDMNRVGEAFDSCQFTLSQRVLRYLRRQGWTLSTVREVVMALEMNDFHKSQEHKTRADAWLDIYRPVWRGERLYVKLTCLGFDDQFHVLSFCRDGEAH